MTETKIQERFDYDGFGFTVTLIKVPMVKVRGEWTPDINYNELAENLLEAIARTPGRLTGDEIRFVRHHFEYTLAQFGTRFSVSHPAVIKWEETGSDVTAMKWTVEKDIRQFILRSLGKDAAQVGELYGSLEKEHESTSTTLSLNVTDGGAAYA